MNRGAPRHARARGGRKRVRCVLFVPLAAVCGLLSRCVSILTRRGSTCDSALARQAAVDIILAFPPTTPRSRQRIIENMGSAEGGDKTAAHGPALLRRTPIVTPTLKRHAMEPSAAAAAAAAAAAGPTFANALALGPQGPLQLRAPALR